VELDNASQQRAWAIEGTEQDLALIYRAMGPLREGLERIENVGPKLAGVVEELIQGSI
jgi:hypothetical protein